MASVILALVGACGSAAEDPARFGRICLDAFEAHKEFLDAQALRPDDGLDRAIAARFGTACGLRRHDGLSFGDGRRTYSCGLSLAAHPTQFTTEGQARVVAIDRAFGSGFHDELSKLDEAQRLAHAPMLIGIDKLLVVLLAKEDGDIEIVSTLSALSSRSIRTVNMLAAADLLQLANAVGFTSRTSFYSMCAATVEADASGWTFVGLQQQGCRPVPALRDWRVQRDGGVSLLRQKPVEPAPRCPGG